MVGGAVSNQIMSYYQKAAVGKRNNNCCEKVKTYGFEKSLVDLNKELSIIDLALSLSVLYIYLYLPI